MRALSYFIDFFTVAVETFQITYVAPIVLLLNSCSSPLDATAVTQATANSLSPCPTVKRLVLAKPLGLVSLAGSSLLPTIISGVPTPCCLLVRLEDPGSRTPVLSCRSLHLGNLTSQPSSFYDNPETAMVQFLEVIAWGQTLHDEEERLPIFQPERTLELAACFFFWCLGQGELSAIAVAGIVHVASCRMNRRI